VVNSVTTYFVRTHYEVTGSEVTKYHYAGTQRIAMRQNGDLFFIIGDHLGSTSLVTDSNGAVISEVKYKAWGEVRYASGTTLTNYTYTGQYSYVSDFGLMFYNARWYDPSLGRFAQADTIVPSGVQGLDRYAYGLNNPSRYTDPSGHIPVDCYGTTYCGASNSDLLPDFKPSKPKGGGRSPGDWKPSGGSVTGNQSSSYSYTYDTMKLSNLILPWSSETWGAISLTLDEIALGLDWLAGVIVLGHVGLGAAGTLTFEGNPAGAAGGYILGELNPVVRGLVNGGNIIATFVTQAGLIQALKDGSHRNVTTLTVSPNNISVSSRTRISGNAMLAVGLTGLGWAAQPVSLSLPAQYAAVQNDKGNIPLPSITFTNSINITIP